MATPLSLIENVVRMQDQLNKKIFPDWQQKDFAWNRAIWTEAAELIESTQWKWWKHSPIQRTNIRVEMVDIFHFITSWSVKVVAIAIEEERPAYEKKKQTPPELINHTSTLMHNAIIVGINESKDITKTFGKLSKTVNNPDPQDLEKFRSLVEAIAASALKKASPLGILQLWGEAWGMLGLDVIDLIRDYLVKNTLNNFRQDRGYKTGGYYKNWSLVEGKIVEDNDYVFDLATKIALTNTFAQDLYEAMDGHYKTVVEFNSDPCEVSQ